MKILATPYGKRCPIELYWTPGFRDLDILWIVAFAGAALHREKTRRENEENYTKLD
jgi:hypothetical protein